MTSSFPLVWSLKSKMLKSKESTWLKMYSDLVSKF